MSDVTLKAVLLGEDRSMSRTFDKAGTSAESAGKKTGGFSSMLAGLVSPAGLAIAATAGLTVGFSKLVGFLGDSVAEGREAAKVGKTTAQIIKSTGGAAKVSADQVGDLAESLSVKAGVDDEVIQTGANLLLTFKKVRNEVGQGNAIFDRATAAAVDLSATGFGSIDSASKMLGKALNDPLKGISALSRAGVTFTDQQKKQIATLIESGKTLEAQKIILAEVESQVGGVAEASADMGDKVGVAWGNFKEKIGTALLPVLDKLGGWFVEKGIPALERFFHWTAEKLWPALKEAWQTILPGVTKALDILTGGTGEGEMSWKKFGDIITNKVIPFLAKLFRVYIPAAAAQIRAVIEVVKAAWKAFETWRDITLGVVAVILRSFASVASGIAKFLRALSHIPGFGWAKTAADKMDRAADKARELATNIDRIRSKTVNVHVRFSSSGRQLLSSGGRSLLGGLTRAGGGPVIRGATYLVGENGPELFTAGESGHISPKRQTAAALAANTGAGDAPADDRPILVQLLLDGRVIQEALLRRKRQTGMALGLS